MKTLLYIAIIITFSTLVRSQVFHLAPQSFEMIHKIAFSAGQNTRYDIFQQFGFDEHPITIRKSVGNVVTEKSLKLVLSINSSGVLHDAVSDYDGFLYLLIGSENQDIRLLKLDSDVTVLWNVKVGNALEFTNDDIFYYTHKLVELDSDNLAVSMSKFGHQELVKISKSGSVLWRKKYSGINCHKCRGLNIVPTSDGAILTLKDYARAGICKIDMDGNLLWSRSISDGHSREAEFVFIKDNFIYQFGKFYQDAYLVVLDQMGNQILNKTYSSTEFSMAYFYENQFYLEFKNHSFETNTAETRIFKLDDELQPISEHIIVGQHQGLFSESSSNLNNNGGHFVVTLNGNYSSSFYVGDLDSDPCIGLATPLFLTVGENPNIWSETVFLWETIVSETLPEIIPLSQNVNHWSSNVSQRVSACNLDIVGIQVNESEAFKLYPNPSNGEIQLQINTEIESLIILDNMGRKLYQINTPASSLNLNHLDAGNYFIQITRTNGLVLTEPIVIVK